MFGYYLLIYIEQEKLNSEGEFIEESADATAIRYIDCVTDCMCV
ncbi:MAG: hypothetical protein K0S25_134 [Bacillus sp. (in: firmicutes)]|jgi:hypothetical protein|nr:hypothetical protein [Neobacillus sp.]MDF2902496.1 hypothetical protein [Bacillus sp. (in: firmicutes)]